jgi:AhpD family alkylhydroperoxidase
MKGTLDAKLRELAYIKVSLVNNCPYCAGPHITMGQRAGLTEDQIREIADYRSSQAFTDLEKLVLQYAEELTRNVKRTDDLLEALKNHLSEKALVELNLTIGMANLTNRFNVSFATDPD